MDELLGFVGARGYLVLFAWVWLEQVGLPVPGEPILVAVGALAGAGQLGLPAVFGIATVACVLADLGWYAIGRRWGNLVLRRIRSPSRSPAPSRCRSVDSSYSTPLARRPGWGRSSGSAMYSPTSSAGRWSMREELRLAYSRSL